MPFKIVRNDITKVKADAIVNTANPQPIYASGTDGAIYQAAGAEDLLAERKKIGVIKPGEAFATPAFALSAKYIIHTVGPPWIDGKHKEFEILSSCYQNSLELAENLQCGRIAFPLIATGIYEFPKDLALQTAVSTISRFLLKSDMDVFLIVFDRKAFELSGRLFSDIDAFIDENYVVKKQDKEYTMETVESARILRCTEKNALLEPNSDDEVVPALNEFLSKSEPSLEDAVSHVGQTFQQRLLSLGHL